MGVKKLFFVESSDIGSRYCAPAARALAFEPVYLCNLSAYHGDPLRELTSCLHAPCDTNSGSAVAQAIRELLSANGQGLDALGGVMTLADTHLMAASQAALLLGVPGNDAAVIRLKDKSAVAALVPEYGPPSLGFAKGAPPLPELERMRFLSPSGRLILKPVCGAGALGTFVVSSAAEVEALPSRLAETRLEGGLDDRWVAQVFVEGNLISVEGFVGHEGIRFLGFTSRKKIASTETAARFPIDESLPQSLRDRARGAVRDLVGRSGFARGYFHIEFIAHGQQCWLIDANMGRVGGGAIAEQLAVSFGSTPLEVFKHILSMTLHGKAEHDPYAGTPVDTFAVFYGVEREARILGVSLPEGSECFHTMVLGEGATAPPLGCDDWAWVGILSGRTPAVERTIREMRIMTDRGAVAPVF